MFIQDCIFTGGFVTVCYPHFCTSWPTVAPLLYVVAVGNVVLTQLDTPLHPLVSVPLHEPSIVVLLDHLLSQSITFVGVRLPLLKLHRPVIPT